MTEFPKLMLIDRSAFPSKIKLPDVLGYISEVFPLKLNSHWLEVEAQSYAWFDSYGIHSGTKRQKFFDSAFSLVTALSYPDADMEHLRTAMDFLLWLFAFDDMTDQLEGEFRDSVHGVKLAIDVTMGVLRNPDSPPPTLRIAASLHSFFNRMRSSASPGTIKRFVETTDLYTQAILQQTINRSADRVPTVEEFIQLRRNTSGVMPSFAVLEYTLDLDLPEEVYDDPIIAELAQAGSDLITWTNDIFSFPIEQAQGDTQNLVFIAMWNKKLELQDAIDYVDQLLRKRVEDFVDAKKQLRSFGPDLDDKVASYILGIEYWVRGSAHWIFETPRFFGEDAKKVKETGVVGLMLPPSGAGSCEA